MRLPTTSREAAIARMAPTARLACACLLVAAILVSGSTLRGSALTLGMLLVWVFLCRFPLKALGKLLGMGLLLFFSTWGTMILAAWAGEGKASIGLAWNMAFKGVALAAMAWSTILTFRLGALLRTTSVLPGIAATLLEQIAHQTLSLMDESQRISKAWDLRGATGRASLALLRAAPVVWLPRVAHRAERVAAAMELRGTPSHHLFRERAPFTWREGLGLALSTLAMGASVLVRWFVP